MGRGHQENIVIVGAGIAGLSAACHLAESGHSPLVIDAGTFPHHRVCGQFLSPESLPLLRRWDLFPPALIETCVFKKENSEATLHLPDEGGSWSRYDFDEAFLQKAKALGACILTETKVDRWERSGERWKLYLSNGDILSARLLIVGAGRFAAKAFHPQYLGIKAHFSGIFLKKQLEMHFFKGGYVGVSPIGPDTINIAGIAPLDTDPSMLLSLEGLAPLKETLAQGNNLFSEWMSTKIPKFGIRRPPSYPNILWIGDAAGSIPPICGEGLTIAIVSGTMAAEYALRGEADHFRKAWLKTFRSCFRFAAILHACAMSPVLSKGFFQACRWFPHLPRRFFEWTRLKA